MNSVHWHLILNHVPIVGTFFGLLILAHGARLRSQEILRVSLALLFVSGVLVIPVYQTGHAAEELAEELSGVTEKTIHDHAESAETSYYLALILGVIALGGLIQTYRKDTLSYWILLLVGILGIVVFVSFLRTANDGALIRHPEIHMNAPESGGHDNSNGHQHEH